MTVGNLAELAALDGMPSEPSLTRFIAARADFPLIERGQHGKAYVIDLDAAAAFVRTHWRDGRNERRLRRLAQLSLPTAQLILFEDGADQ